MLIGYDVEHPFEDGTAPAFLDGMATVHRELEAPATLFASAWTLKLHAERFRSLATDPLFEVGSHLFGRERVKSLLETGPNGVRLLPAYPLGKITASMAQGAVFFEEVLGKRPRGLTTPYGFPLGLADRPDLVSLFKSVGFDFVRSWGRNAQGWQPVAFERQPFWYELQGQPELLEIPMQGWQDSLWRDTHGWENLAGYRAELDRSLDHIAEHNLVWSWVGHDWSCLKSDPELSLVRHLIEGAKRRGVKLATHGAFFDAAVKTRPSYQARQKAAAPQQETSVEAPAPSP